MSADDEKLYLSMVFEIKSPIDVLPYHLETAYGRPVDIYTGNACEKIKRLEAKIERLQKALDERHR